MPFQHEMQASRYELKYVVDELKAQAIRDFLRSHLVPDQFAHPVTNSYTIHSLYLDNLSLALYRSTVDGLKNRYKLRIRFYDGDPDHPAFLEIKRRTSDVIRKERAAITRAGVCHLLTSRWADASHLIDHRPKAVAAFHNFCRTCKDIGAAGSVYVSYEREAYVSPDSDDLRVTFDRELRGARYQQGAGIGPPSHSTPVNVGGVVLEIKFTNRFPRWLHDLVTAFNLKRGPLAKYVNCLEAIGEAKVNGALAGKE